MAIRDLLYACVECGRESGLKPAEKEEICDRCGTRYRRGVGASITCVRPNGVTETRPAAEWLDQLRSHFTAEETRQEPRDRVVIRVARTHKPVRHRGVYLGKVELFGQVRSGWLTLGAQHLRFDPDSGVAEVWPLEQITAVQPSSTMLQIKLSRGPVCAVRFLEASSLLWEERIRNAVQRLYTERGRGDIAEYQPRIACR